MRKLSCTLTLLTVWCAVILSSCGEIQVITTPDSFARFDREKDFRAASADGVMMKAYEIADKNIDSKTAEKTWVEEIDRALVSKGYVNVAQKDLPVSSSLKGIYREYSVIYNGETYLYAYVLIKKEARLFIAEMAGPKKEYEGSRESMLTSVKTWKIE